MSKNPVVHFEMPYKDAKRVAEFYNKAFGWNMADAGEQMGHYVTAATAETDENRMVKTPGTINGGFYDLKMSEASQQPSVVISVPDVKEAIKDVEAAGGTNTNLSESSFMIRQRAIPNLLGIPRLKH
jgi:predicted enzyme related to lactoylglutathione lyase